MAAIDREISRTKYEKTILLQDREITSLSELTEADAEEVQSFLASLPTVE
jgi:hypothetical protein